MPDAISTIVPTVMVVHKYAQFTGIISAFPKSHHRNLLSRRVSPERQQAVYHFFINLLYPPGTGPMRIFLTVTGIKRLFDRYSIGNGDIFLPIPVSILMRRPEMRPFHVYPNFILFFHTFHLLIEDYKRIPLHNLDRRPIFRSPFQKIKYPILSKQFPALHNRGLYR